MKKTILSFIILTLFVTSCKKKTTIEPENTVTTTGNTSTGNFGVFTSSNSSIITNTLIYTYGSTSSAFVSNTALVGNSPLVGSLLDMGNLSLNNVTFNKNGFGPSAPNMYKDTTTGSTYNTPHNWVVSGSASVPGFSFTNTNPYPTYTGQAAVADSFVIANNISIPLINYTGAVIKKNH